tara:strand:+ start:54 stop:1172 length:1119 start_codon:yes stop_codon:yes gene_type:complete
MKNRVYTYFFYEFFRYFTVILFALTAIIWTIQAVNFLDLVIEDGHAFKIYIFYSSLSVPKILTKLIPFSFLLACVLTISKFERDNELIILWTTGVNKIQIVKLIFRISLVVMVIQLFLSTLITPKTLNFSRSLLKNSELQFVPSLLKERQFNDTVEGLTVFVDKKEQDGIYKNIFIRDDSNVLTQVSSGSSTIFAKSGYISKDEKILYLENGNIQKLESKGSISVISFEKTQLNLSGLSTKTISEPKIQETSTFQIIQCMKNQNLYLQNCSRHKDEQQDAKIEINKRFGMPIFIPLIALISCFLLSTRKLGKNLFKHTYLILGIIILISSEITVRYSGSSLNHAFIYYFIPIGFIPLLFFLLFKKFKYENVN